MGYIRNGILFSHEEGGNLIQVPRASNCGASLPQSLFLLPQEVVLRPAGLRLSAGHTWATALGHATKPGGTMGWPEPRGRLALEGWGPPLIKPLWHTRHGH